MNPLKPVPEPFESDAAVVVSSVDSVVEFGVGVASGVDAGVSSAVVG